MKKIVFAALFVSLLGNSLMAQDTLDLVSPKSNYYYNYWPDSAMMEYQRVIYGSVGVRFLCQDEMTVYGVAAILLSPVTMGVSGDFLPDTYDYSVPIQTDMYLLSHDSLDRTEMRQLGEKMNVVEGVTAPSYYLRTNVPESYYMSIPAPILPLYEKYLPTPQVVKDSFYVAVGSDQAIGDEESGKRPLPFGIGTFTGLGGWMLEGLEGLIAYYYADGDTWLFRAPVAALYTFPILTPAPEEPVEPGDTTAIGGVDMVSRYVSVQPNPATEEARVLSSFGLQRIEAFDGGGRQMLDVQAEGMQAVLDVRGWSGGTYLLRITTPMGTTTKKLIVR